VPPAGATTPSSSSAAATAPSGPASGSAAGGTGGATATSSSTPRPEPYAALIESADSTLAVLRDSKDPRELVHALGHLLREDLRPEQFHDLNTMFHNAGSDMRLDPSGAWFKKGPTASATPTDAEIEAAEDLFAGMLVKYIETGKAPPGTVRSLDSVKDQLAAVAGVAPTGGISPELQDFFDRIYGFEPNLDAQKRAADAAKDPKAFKLGLWQRLVNGPPVPRSPVALDELAKAAQSAGIDTNAAKLAAQLEKHGRIDFATNVLGKGSYTPDDVAELQKELGREWRAAREERPGSTPIELNRDAQQEEWLSEKLWAHAERPARTPVGKAAKAIEKAALTTYIGLDAYKDLRKFSEPLRDPMLVAQRKVESAYADALKLVRERSPERLRDYLLGARTDSKHGRPLLSSGRSKVGPLRNRLSAAMGRLSAQAQDGARLLMGNPERLDELDEAGKRAVLAAVDGLLYADSAPVFNKQLVEVVGAASKAPGTEAVNAHTKEMRLAGALARFGVHPNPGAALDDLLNVISQQYGGQAAARAATLMAGHGTAGDLNTVWRELGIAINEEQALLFKKWVNGQRIPPEKVEEIRKIARRVGMDAEFVDAAMIADGVGKDGLYVPKEAMDRALKVLSKSTQERAHFLSPVDELRNASNQPDMARAWASVLAYLKATKTRGVVAIRKWKILADTFDSMYQTAHGLGVLPALMSALRVLPQTTLALFPGIARVVYHAEQLDLLNPASLEAAKDMLQKVGDAGAHAIARMASYGAVRMDVSEVLRGSSEVKMFGGRAYRYSDLRAIAEEEGVFSSMPRHTDRVFEEAGGIGPGVVDDVSAGTALRNVMSASEDFVEDMTEGWAERERLGLMMSLVELGIEPRQAARMTTRFLYDYGTSVTHAERSGLLGVVKPFWSFEKNANRMVIDAALSPVITARANALRRFAQYGPEAISELLYAYSADPYGVDPAALPPEAVDSYYMLRSEVESHYGGYEHVPPDVRYALAAIFRDVRGWEVRGGQLYEQPASLTAITEMAQSDYRFEAEGTRDAEGNLTPRKARLNVTDAVVPHGDASARPTFRRDMPAIIVPPKLTEATQKYLRLAESETGSTPQIDLYLPQTATQSGVQHVASMMAAQVGALYKILDGLRDDPDSPATALSPSEAFQYVVDPERTMLLPELSDAMFDTHLAAPARVSPMTADLFRQIGFTVVETSSVADPFVEEVSAPAASTSTSAGTQHGVVTPTENPQTLGRDKRYYLMPGKASLTWQLTPFVYQLDQRYLAAQPSPLERAMDVPGEMDRTEALQLLRVLIESPQAEVYRGNTARQEEPRFQSTSTTPSGKLMQADGL